MPVVGSVLQSQFANQHDQKTADGPQDACLGIDIGSHRSRVCLWKLGTTKPIVVENKAYHGLTGPYTPCDFPSALYIFDDVSQDVYFLEDEDLGRQCVSAKYAFYPLANASDTLLEQYPSVHHLTSRKDDPMFRAQLRRGLIALLSGLRDAASAVCYEQGLRIVRIGLTIPVQWGLEFEDLYRGLVMEVFRMRDLDQIHFFTETEALSRYLYKHHAHELDPRDRHDAILFLDFGGHNMNGCLFGVARDHDRPDGNSFFRVGSPFGAGGGSEQWEYHIVQWFSDRFSQDTKVPVPPNELEDFLTRFRSQKNKRAASRRPITTNFPMPNSIDTWRATLTVEEIEHAWKRGLRGPLRTAEREISRLVERTKLGVVSQPLVVVSGGTARNPAVKSRITSLCDAKGVSVVFTDEFNVRIAYDSAKVAMAAAYVVSETLTVEEFFQRGAAIGLQMRQAREQGKPKTEPREWDDWGRVLLDLDGHHTVKFSARRTDEFRLICDPFFSRLPRNQRERLRVPVSRTYDLVYLGRLKQGSWTFRPSLRGSGDDMLLEIEQLYRRKDNARLRFRTDKTLKLPLYFDRNSSCIHVGARNCDISELGLDLPPQPTDEEGETSSDDDDDSELESDMDSDFHM
ncbi:uncharacterized protein B0H64DRAFT_398279 [Chaetomium fimeti]|uniref:Uncharacterized protein n=1 Tax=Chaetomium fimeti TaxID=1854472 RepID=A0AAE0LSS3_9PEZI|nr:hypothetical protein B0H64DRAFT_398279 [Chaetomium fimeti]